MRYFFKKPFFVWFFVTAVTTYKNLIRNLVSKYRATSIIIAASGNSPQMISFLDVEKPISKLLILKTAEHNVSKK